MNIPTNLGFTTKDIANAVQRKDIIIIIDVLRCCSTIITALENAADGVIPTRTLRYARALRQKHPEFLLAGERKGIKPKEFDLGNSPLEFSSPKVRGKSIILTTTSGAKAIISSKDAEYVFIGALLNAKAVAKVSLTIAEQEKTGISLISAGTNSQFSLEDFTGAGAIAQGFPADKVEHSDAVSGALLAFQRAHGSLTRVIQSGSHARRLESLGFEEDVKFCCRLNVFEIVPFFKGGTIVPFTKAVDKEGRINEFKRENCNSNNRISKQQHLVS